MDNWQNDVAAIRARCLAECDALGASMAQFERDVASSQHLVEQKEEDISSNSCASVSPSRDLVAAARLPVPVPDSTVEVAAPRSRSCMCSCTGRIPVCAVFSTLWLWICTILSTLCRWVCTACSALWSCLCAILNAVRIRSCFGRRSRFWCCGYCGDQPHVKSRTQDDDKIAFLMWIALAIGVYYYVLWRRQPTGQTNGDWLDGWWGSTAAAAATETTSVWMGKPILTTCLLTCIGGFLYGVVLSVIGSQCEGRAKKWMNWLRNLSSVGVVAKNGSIYYEHSHEIFSYVMLVASAASVFAGCSFGRLLSFMLCCEHAAFSDAECQCAVCHHELCLREEQRRARQYIQNKQSVIDAFAPAPSLSKNTPLDAINGDLSAEQMDGSWNGVKRSVRLFAVGLANDALRS